MWFSKTLPYPTLHENEDIIKEKGHDHGKEGQMKKSSNYLEVTTDEGELFHCVTPSVRTQ